MITSTLSIGRRLRSANSQGSRSPRRPALRQDQDERVGEVQASDEACI
jgi:hypothetical protein